MSEEQTCLVEVSCSLLYEFSSQSFPDPQLSGLQKLSKSLLTEDQFHSVEVFYSFCRSKTDIRGTKSSLMSEFFLF